MTILETIGMAWVIFTSSLATVGIVYLSIVGLKTLKREQKDADVPVEVKDMFKIAR
jgi:hypothetical protein